MNKKLRQIITTILLFAGLALLIYGQFVKTHSVLSNEGDVTTSEHETSIVKEVTRHGVDRNAEGLLFRTYSTQEGAAPPPDDCPT